MKRVGKILLWILGVAVALVLTLPLWLSPVARLGANLVVPRMTGAPFHLDRFNLSLDWLSLATDTIVVKDVAISGLYYEQNLNMPAFSSFGGKAGKSDSATVKEDGGGPLRPVEAGAEKAPEEKSSKKVIVDHLLLENVVIAVGAVKIPVPKIELSGIGRKSGGATMPEIWDEVSVQVMRQANAGGRAIGELVNGLNAQDAGKMIEAVRAIDPKKFDKHADKAMKVLEGFLK